MKNHLPKEVKNLLSKAKDEDYLYINKKSYNIYTLFNNYYNAQYMHQFAVLVLGLKFFMYCIDNNIGSKIHVYGDREPTERHLQATGMSNNTDYEENSGGFNFKSRNKKQKLEYGLTLYDEDNKLDLSDCDVTWGRFYIYYHKNTISIATRYILFDDLENPKTIRYHFIGSNTDNENTIIKMNIDEITDKLKAQSNVSNYFRGFRLVSNLFAQDEKINEKYFNKLLNKMFISDFPYENESLDVHAFKKLQEKRNSTGLLGEIIAAIYETVNNQNDIEFKSFDNVNAGYDILCKDNKNNKKYIEVKTTINSADCFNFYISQNEYDNFKKNKNSFLYCVKISDKLLENEIAYGKDSKTIIFNKNEYLFNKIESIKELKKAIINEDIKIYIINNPAKKFNLSKYFETKKDKTYEFSINNINVKIYDIKYYSEEYTLKQ